MAVRQQCVKLRHQPGWADIEGASGRKAAIVLTLPDGSDMAEKWADAGLGGLTRGPMGNLTEAT